MYRVQGHGIWLEGKKENEEAGNGEKVEKEVVVAM